MNTATCFILAALLFCALSSASPPDPTLSAELTKAPKRGSGGGAVAGPGGGFNIPGFNTPGSDNNIPGFSQPGFGQPGFGQPGFGQPGFGQPGFGQPGFGGGYGGGYGGPSGGHGYSGVIRPTVVCREKGPCYKKKLVCPAKCFKSFSRSGKNYGGGGGGGGCTMDCRKKCVAYC